MGRTVIVPKTVITPALIEQAMNLPAVRDALPGEVAPRLALATVRATLNTPPTPTADALNVNAYMLLGGQIAGGKMGLYLIYGQGNFIECGPDTPYLQIGELKYGKPILDRVVTPDTSLADAQKAVLESRFRAVLAL